jgi:hypothetical protein
MTRITQSEANDLLYELCGKHYGNVQSVRRAMMDEGIIEVGQELTASHVHRLAARLIEKGRASKPVTMFHAPVGKAQVVNAQPYTRAFGAVEERQPKAAWSWSDWRASQWEPWR